MVVGVDVGGPAKGFHAVALEQGRLVEKTRTRDPQEIAAWCRAQGAIVVALDAPCRWRSSTVARAAERELAKEKISCFVTPTETDAAGHSFFTWMFAGHDLFRALHGSHPVCADTTQRVGVSIENFPQAVACALAGQVVSAKKKGIVRRELLERSGVGTESLRTIDELDAALCAVAAESFAAGNFKAYGDATDGFIIVPAAPAPKHRHGKLRCGAPGRGHVMNRDRTAPKPGSCIPLDRRNRRTNAATLLVFPK